MSNHHEIQAAIQLFQGGNIKQAKSIVDRYVVDYPNDVNINLLSAAISAAESDFSAVVKKCSHILTHEPANTRAAYNAAVASEKLKNYQDVSKYSSMVMKYDPSNVSVRLLLAGALYDQDKYDAARQLCIETIASNINDAGVINNIRMLFSVRHDNDIVEKIFIKALGDDAGNTDLLFNLVMAKIATGDIAAADTYKDQLMAIDDHDINTIKANVLVLFSQGKLKKCIDYIKTLSSSITAGDPLIAIKLAECYMGISENDKAVNIFKQCLAANVNAAECYHNIGIIEDRRGNFDEAIKAYQSSLSIKPDSFSSNYNLAFVLDNTGDKQQALDAMRRCYEIQDSAKVRQAYVKILSTADVAVIDSKLNDILLSILSDDITNVQSLSRLVSELVKVRYPLINELFILANDDRYDDFVMRIKSSPDVLAEIKLLQLSLIHLPITQYEFECFVRMLRRALLLEFSIDSHCSESLFSLCSAIAVRCYVDGYVFTVTDTERRMVDTIFDQVLKATDAVDDKQLVLLSMYLSLYDLYRDHGISLHSSDYEGVFKDLLRLQLDDNIAEESLYDSIQSLSEINDQTSLTVKKQYESNPYPVWQRLDKREPESIVSIMRSVTLRSGKMVPDFDEPEILIAGCGTGSHALQTAMRIQHRSMVAIDLSMRSLAFAKRKADEYGMYHIDFKQVDILNVNELGKKFDVIESVGVLHHMESLSTGLKSLVDILKPGGFFCIGLYSKIARRYIIKAKSIYDNADRYVTDDEIRQARVDLMASDDEALMKNIRQCKDFYALHDCRDLIFHENEHNYSLDEVSDLIANAGLEFVGFDSHEPLVLSRYKKMFPEDKDMSDLKNWAVFEDGYPDTFAGMYVFWCCKKIKLF